MGGRRGRRKRMREGVKQVKDEGCAESREKEDHNEDRIEEKVLCSTRKK